MAELLSMTVCRSMAQDHFDWSIREGMGLFMIAEAWGIEPWAKTQYGGHGALTEGYVVEQMALQVREMMRGKEEGNPSQRSQGGTVCVLRPKPRDSGWDMGDIGQRSAGVCKR